MFKLIVIVALLFAVVAFNNPKEAATEYKLLTGATLRDLQAEVNRNISHGYQPQGGVASIEHGYAQAMVK